MVVIVSCPFDQSVRPVSASSRLSITSTPIARRNSHLQGSLLGEISRRSAARRLQFAEGERPADLPRRPSPGSARCPPFRGTMQGVASASPRKAWSNRATAGVRGRCLSPLPSPRPAAYRPLARPRPVSRPTAASTSLPAASTVGGPKGGQAQPTADGRLTHPRLSPRPRLAWVR